MSLVDTISNDLTAAMKSSDKTALSTLRLVKSSLKYREIEKGGSLSDDDVVAVLSSLVKQRKESIEQYAKAGRHDLASAEEAEITVLRKYMPAQMADDELERLVRQTIGELNAAGAKDVGRVMKAVMPLVKGRADGKQVNAQVSRILSD